MALELDHSKEKIGALTTNGALVLAPNGGGALQAADLGNTRGTFATDLQRSRSASTQVASGNYGSLLGGLNNTCSGHAGVVPGGESNSASGGYHATVLGGILSVAGADGTIAGGRRAKANHTGAIVLADYTDADFASAVANEFAVRASGGVRLATGGAGLSMDGQLEVTGNIEARTATFQQEVDNSASGTAKTVDWTAGQKQKLTLTGNCTLSFTAPSGVGNFLLKILQDATGGRTVAWPANVKWAGGAPPTLTTAANAVDIVSLYYDGTDYYGVVSLNFA